MRARGGAGERVALPDPSRRERRHVLHLEARVLGRKPVQYLARTVGGAVVHHQQVEARVVLREERSCGGFHALTPFFVQVRSQPPEEGRARSHLNHAIKAEAHEGDTPGEEARGNRN